jgi:hypothetical protein
MALTAKTVFETLVFSRYGISKFKVVSKHIPDILECDRATFIIIIIIIISCHRSFLPGTSVETAVIPIAQVSSFTLQYFPYYV